MNRPGIDEAALARLLAGARAEADPAVLARVRARLAAPAVPRPLAWLGTPAALAGACALLLCAAGVSFVVARGESAATSETTMISSLVGDDGSYGLPAAVTSDAGGTADSGEVSR